MKRLLLPVPGIGKKFVSGAAAILCSIVLLLSALLMYAGTEHAENQIIDVINSKIPGTLSADNIDFSILKTFIELKDVEIRDLQDNVCLNFKTLICDFTVSSLLKKIIEINQLSINQPRVHLVADKEGINLINSLISADKPLPVKEDTSSGGKNKAFNVVVNTAQIVDGLFTFRDEKTQFAIKNINAGATSGDLAKQVLMLDVALKGIHLSLQDKVIQFQNIRLLSELKQNAELNFDFEAGSDLLDLKSSGIVQNVFTSPEIDVRMDATSQLENLGPLLDDQLKPGGNARINVSGKGSIANPTITIDLDGAGLTFKELSSPGSMSFKVALNDRIVSIDRGILDFLGNQIAISGRTDVRSLFPNGFLNPPKDGDRVSYDLSFQQSGGDFKQLDPWVKGFSGRFFSSGRIKGKGIDPNTLEASCDIRLTLDDVGKNHNGTAFLDMDSQISGHLSKGVFQISQFRAATTGTTLTADGRFDLLNEMIEAGIKFHAPDLSAATAPLGDVRLTGAVEGEVDISGKAANPSVNATVRAHDLNFKGISVRELAFESMLEPSGRAVIKRLLLKDNDLTFNMTGSADIFDTGFKLKDTITADLSVSGKKINPGTILKNTDMELNLDLFDSRVDFTLDLDVAYALNDAALNGNPSTLVFPSTQIEAGIDLGKKQVSFLMDKSTSLNLFLDPDIRRYNTQITFVESDLVPMLETMGIKGILARVDGHITAAGNMPVQLPDHLVKGLALAEGRIDLTGKLAGRRQSPDFDVSMKLSGLNYDLIKAGINITGLSGNLKATPEKVMIHDLHSRINEGHFQLNGEALINDFKVRNGQLDLTAKNLVIPLASKTGTKEDIRMDTLNSRLDFNLDYVSGKKEKPALSSDRPIPVNTIETEVNLEDLSLNLLIDKTIDLYAAFDPDTSEYEFDMKFTQTVLDTFLKTAGLNTAKGRVNGYIRSKGNAKTALPAEVAESLKKAEGKVSGKAELNGTVNAPEVKATIQLAGIGYPVPTAGLDLTGLNGFIRADNHKLEIENLTAGLGEGRMNLDGRINLEAYQPVKGDIRFTAENIFIELPDTAMFGFDSDVRFFGTKEKSDLTGRVQLLKGEYVKDFTFDLADAVGQKKRSTATPEQNKIKDIPFISNAALNIDVDYKDPLTLDNNLAFILIEPNITVTGKVSNPIITGRSKIVEGVILYQKKEFEIEKGIIDFTDPYKIEPEIDLAAKSRIRDWLINLEIRGKTDNLNFRLYSEPEETHQDILSLLITGKTTKELGKKGGSYTGMLTDKAADVISRGVEESTPLDSFKVGYDGSKTQGSNVSVTMGKKLSKRLEVTYSLKTEDEETVHTNEAEYKLLENFMFKAFNDSKGEFGTEFMFKLEFR